MSIVPRSIFRDMETMRERLDRFFADVTDGSATAPLIDVQETDDAVVVKASVPGFKPEDIHLAVRHGVLTIRGESTEERDETQGTWHVKERRFGSIYRTVTLPADVKDDDAAATIDDGVLEVRLPKREARAPREIPVRSGSKEA